jgi:hypothetical protein
MLLSRNSRKTLKIFFLRAGCGRRGAGSLQKSGAALSSAPAPRPRGLGLGAVGRAFCDYERMKFNNEMTSLVARSCVAPRGWVKCSSGSAPLCAAILRRPPKSSDGVFATQARDVAANALDCFYDLFSLSVHLQGFLSTRRLRGAARTTPTTRP